LRKCHWPDYPYAFPDYARKWNKKRAADAESLPPPPPDPQKDISLGVLRRNPFSMRPNSVGTSLVRQCVAAAVTIGLMWVGDGRAAGDETQPATGKSMTNKDKDFAVLESEFGRAEINVVGPRLHQLVLRRVDGTLADRGLLSLWPSENRDWPVGGYSYVVGADGVRYESPRSKGHKVAALSNGVRMFDIALVSTEGKAAPLTETWELTSGEDGSLRWQIERRWTGGWTRCLEGSPGLFFNARANTSPTGSGQRRLNPGANAVITSIWFERAHLDGRKEPLYWDNPFANSFGDSMFAENGCVTARDRDAWAVIKLYANFPLDHDLKCSAKGYLYRRGTYNQFSEIGVAAAAEATHVSRAGDIETTTLVLARQPQEDTGHQLAIRIPDPDVEAPLKRYYGSLLNGGTMCDQKLHDFGNQPDGWKVGFTPVIEADALSAGVPGPKPVSSRPLGVADALREALDMRFAALQEDGVMRYGFAHSSENTVFVEYQTSLVLAVERYLLHTGDAGWCRERFPLLERALAVCIRNAQAEGNHGLVSWKQDRVTTGVNWYMDGIKASGTLAYHNVFYYGAVQAMARIADALGLGERAGYYRRLADQIRGDFNRVFWREDACGEGRPAYLDWIASDGKGHGYFFSCVQYPAMALGLASAEQAKKILATADRRLAEIAREFPWQGDGTLDCLWPVPKDLCLGEAAKPFGSYMNGGMLLRWTYWEIVARGRSGDSAGAYDRLRRFAAHAARTNWLEGDSAFAIDGRPFGWGGEPFLADQVVVPAAVVHGLLGVQMTWDRLEASPALPKEWPWAEGDVLWKGERHRIRIDGDKVRIHRLKDSPVNGTSATVSGLTSGS
jgi:hypothetical protein